MDASDYENKDSNALISSIREIIFSEDLQRLKSLEENLREFKREVGSKDLEVGEQIENLVARLRVLRDLIQTNESRNQEILTSISVLENRLQEDADTLFQRLTPELSNLIRKFIKASPREMAEALGPVMGEAIRVQIRDSRDEMVDAIYPIIGETVQRALAEFAQELQRNIDNRLNSFREGNYIRRFFARLRGVSDSELMLRGSLPFSIQEIFVIQSDSGLLISHYSHSEEQNGADSDLVGAMLTAIRDFVRDSFSGETEDNETLEEIQYGDLRIAVEPGKHAYVALVYHGVEPMGFNAQLREFATELHVRFGSALRNYQGDSTTLPNFENGFSSLVTGLNPETTVRPMGRGQKLFIWGSLIGFVLFVALACFYLQFTIALLPVAFPGTATPTSTATVTATSTSTFTPFPTDTPTPRFTSTATSTPTNTATVTPTTTPTLTFTPTTEPGPVLAVLLGSVWLHTDPDENTRIAGLALTGGSIVEVIAVFDDWVKIKLIDGTQEGWVQLRWIQALNVIPFDIVTPSP